LDGHDGYWYRQQDIWSKYLRRPMNILGDLYFAQFEKMYRSFSQSKPSEEENGHPDAKGIDDNASDDDGYAICNWWR
jgi:hypothetical protein